MESKLLVGFVTGDKFLHRTVRHTNLAGGRNIADDPGLRVGKSIRKAGFGIRIGKADAEPGELVHITKDQLRELYEFNRKFSGIGALSRVYEEITYQQHAAQRWATLYHTQARLTLLWRNAFLIATLINMAIQIYRAM